MNQIEYILAKMSFSGRTKTRIIRQLQRMLDAGIPLMTTLDMLYTLYSQNGRKPREPLALMVSEWRKKLNAGKGLAGAMHGWVTLAEELIIEAGEQSNKLSKAMGDAVEADAASRDIRKAIINSLIYPVILLLVLVGMLWGFSTEIVPTFETILPAEEWTGNARRMYNVSEFVTTWMPLVGMLTIGAITAAILSLPVLTGPIRPYLEYLPPWSVYKITQGASYMISLRAFIAAGTSVPNALRTMLRIGNPYFRERVTAIITRVNMGRNIGEAQMEAGFNFPDDSISGEVSIYSGLDHFDESLDVLAKEWINGARDRAQAVGKVLNNVMLFAVAGTVAMVATAMFELQDLVSQSAQ